MIHETQKQPLFLVILIFLNLGTNLGTQKSKPCEFTNCSNVMGIYVIGPQLFTKLILS